MSFINAGPSPAWFGAFAAMSFATLVAAAFASGYHLASDPPLATPSATSTGEKAAARTWLGPAMVAEPLIDRARAVVRAEPEGEIVDELPAGRSVTITRRSGESVMIRYERDGQTRIGWTHQVNIQPGEP